MKATLLYQHLENDFITSKMSDDWASYMDSIAEFISKNFLRRSMGLVCDFTKEINKVYTAVFPSKKVMQKILKDKVQNAMLFVHHPAIWDIRKAPNVFQQMDKRLLQKFKDNKISIYNLHVPLDNFGDYSTSVTLADALKITSKKPFAPYMGALAGVFGKTDCKTIQILKKRFEKAVGHKVKLYKYGNDEIKDKRIAVVAGGGLDETIGEIAQNNINVLITGITIKNSHSQKAHDLAAKYKINVLGGTHYSTEMFACIKMVEYFKKLGLVSEFIGDDPIIEDM